ncbi:MAG: hypothetical protein HY789_00105 [Deltaproteobacteria bacterium]|nr:hypothetical protein [Deltaproteobacteria bacterium]
MSYDASFWVAVASSTAAWIAALFAYLSARTSKKFLNLSESLEERRQPKLVPYLFEAYYKPANTGKYTIYAFSISISNPSDIDNSIALIELQINYEVSNATKMAVKVRHDPALCMNFCDSIKEHFSLPARIDAHQTIAGWLFFKVDDTLIKDSEIDSYALNICDSHDAMSFLKPIIIREYVDEMEMAKKNL